jgi:type I restriction enzyme S subunit
MTLVAPDHIESETGRLIAKRSAAEQGAISGKYVFEPGDVVYSKIRPYLRKAFVADFDGLCSADMYPLSPRGETDSRFVLATLLGHAFSVFAESASARSGIPKINRDELAEFSVATPPPAEQNAIATALSDVDALLAKLGQLIAKKRDLMQGAMQQLLTGRTRLAGFSDTWRESSFGELFEFLRNASNSRADLSASGDVGYVHYGDIHLHSSPFFDSRRDLLTFIDAGKVKSTPSLRDGDVLMADASEDTEAIGKAVEITGLGGLRAVGGLHTLVLRPRPGRLARGFAGYVQFMPAVRTAIVRAATGVSVYGVSKSSVRAIVTPLPGVEEQSAIAEILSDMGAEIVALEARREKTRQLKQGMMQALLTGRIRLVPAPAGEAHSGC